MKYLERGIPEGLHSYSLTSEGGNKMETKALDIVPKFEISPEDNKSQFDKLKRFISTQMQENEDYGVIPGCKKPSLYKPGAEKLENIFGFYHTFEELAKVEDHDKGFYFYRYRCVVIRRKTGGIVGECIGSCNSKEKRYSGHDPYTLTNTVDKMAQKRAYVGAILNATRVSNEFTQDIEDNPETVSNGRKNVTAHELNCIVCGVGVSNKVADFSTKNFKKVLCMNCQEKEKNAK